MAMVSFTLDGFKVTSLKLLNKIHLVLKWVKLTFTNENIFNPSHTKKNSLFTPKRQLHINFIFSVQKCRNIEFYGNKQA